MNTYVGISGTIECPLALGIEVESVISDQTITLTGSLGTTITLPGYGEMVEGSFRFAVEENVVVDSALPVVLNYVYYGDQTGYKEGPWNGTRLMPGKWDVS
jgi:hypothetical protein